MIAILCITCILGALAGTTDRVDSLQQVLVSAPPEEQAAIHNEIAWEYLHIEPLKALEHAKQASLLAATYDDSGQMALSLRNMGNGHMWLFQYPEAIESYTRALELRNHFASSATLNSIYNNLGVSHKILAEYEDALECYRHSLSIKDELADTLGMTRTLRNMGNVYLAMGDYAETLESWKRSLALARAIRDSAQIAISMAGIAGIHKDLGAYDRALEYGLDALRFAEMSGADAGISDASRTLCIIYKNLGQYEEALKHGMRTLELNLQEGDSLAIAADLGNIAIIFKHMDQFDRALEYQKRSLDICQGIGDRRGEASSVINIGNILRRTGDLPGALEMYNDALAIANDIGNPRTASEAFINMAAVFIDMGRYSDARTAALKSLELGLKEDLLDVLHTSYLYLSDAQAHSGNYREALEYFKLHSSIKDSIFNTESDRRIKELHVRYETEKKEKEIEILRRDAAISELELIQEKNLRRYFIVVSVLIALLALALYNRYRLKTKSHREITRKNEELGVAYRRMEEMARKDPLTDLSNRRNLLERMSYECIRAERTGKPFSIIIGDVDDFKAINDGHGHDCGDFVLVTLAELFRSLLRKQDIVGRWGGEEFLFVIPETDEDGGYVVAEKVRSSIEKKTYAFNGASIPVTMTFGVNTCASECDLDACITGADEACYRGKKRGKNRVMRHAG